MKNYVKFKTDYGILFVKMDEGAYEKKENYHIAFKRPFDENWLFVVNRSFKTPLHALKHILKHHETDGVKFRIF